MNLEENKKNSTSVVIIAALIISILLGVALVVVLYYYNKLSKTSITFTAYDQPPREYWNKFGLVDNIPENIIINQNYKYFD